MHFFKRFIACMSAVLFALSGLNVSVVNYTEGEPIVAERQEYGFDNSRLLIGGYYGGKGNAKYAHDAGLDFVIDSGITAEQLDEYYENGVGVIAAGYNFPGHYGSASADAVSSWANVDMSTYKSHPALWGDDLIDEPNAASFAALETAVKGYRKAIPDQICLINLFPIYADNEQLSEEYGLSLWSRILTFWTDDSSEGTDRFRRYLSDYVNTISTDYICVDVYPYRSKVDTKGNEVKYTGDWYIRNLDIMAQACRDTNRDFWIITQAAGETKDGSDKPSSARWCDEVSDISQQAFASLAFGAKAIIHGLFANKGWWDIDSHMLGSDGKPTETYYAAQKVNLWMKAFAEEYGNYRYRSTYMINKLRVAGFSGLGDLACKIDSEKTDIKSKNGLLVGTFEGESNSKAYIITNMEELNNEVTAEAVFTVPAGRTAVLYQKGETKVYAATAKINISLDPGEGVFITIK